MNSVFINIFYISIVLGIVLFLLSIVLFVAFNIPKVIGNLSGRTAQRDIKKIREKNQQSGVKKYKSSVVNEQRGRKTDKIVSGKLVKQVEIGYGEISTDKLAGNETTVLDNDDNLSNETTVLSDSITENFVSENNETTVLSNETTILGINSSFAVEDDICFTESTEIIV